MLCSTTFVSAKNDGLDRRSIEGYVLPRMLDVAPDHPALVTELLVREYEHVERGQPVARVRRPSPSSGEAPGEALVTSPTSGLVVYRWAAPGEMVGPGDAILSMFSSEDVLVVARFGRAAVPRLHRGAVATVLVGNGSGPLVPARIVSVTGTSKAGALDGAPADGPIRVVLRLPAAPVEALWPGTRATVEL
jgi:multidrug resistance efflux pump